MPRYEYRNIQPLPRLKKRFWSGSRSSMSSLPTVMSSIAVRSSATRCMNSIWAGPMPTLRPRSAGGAGDGAQL